MAAIYRACTGLYPSIYIKYPDRYSYDQSYESIKAVLTEALRVRAAHSKRQIPIVAYSVINYGGLNFFNESILDLAIGQPADMGMDGVAIWGSSNLFKPSIKATCNAITNYVLNTLGPYVSRLMQRVTSCSLTHCNGQGRCVKNEFAKSVPYILGVNIKKGRQDIEDSPEDVYSDYQCQCYDDWSGIYCDTPPSSEVKIDYRK